MSNLGFLKNLNPDRKPTKGITGHAQCG